MYSFGVYAEQPEIVPELSAEELQDFGQVVSIEEGTYPMFTVTIDFFRSEQRVAMNVNVEEIAQNPSELFELHGENVLVHYTSDEDVAFFDLQIGGTLLFGGELPTGVNSFTGILYGPDSETAGDLPDDLYIEDAYGNQKHFAFYVTPEMVLLNGYAVTVFYENRFRQDIRFIQGY